MTVKDGMTLVYVPAGEFTMGTKAEDAFTECQKYKTSCHFDWNKDEEPPHTVELDAFWIDQNEVTNSMYARCVGDGKCNPPSSAKILSTNRIYPGYYYYGNAQFENYPVIYVSWSDASNYCEWANRRLPTEAEWEKAARGTDGQTYPWGNDAPNYGILNYDNAVGYTTEVGRYLDGASPYGALDMAGNVTEWVADWYGESYYVASPISNPRGPNAGNFRVVRGGAWVFDWDLSIRSSNRSFHQLTYHSHEIGFRCAMSILP